MDPITIGQKVKKTYLTGVAKDGRAYKDIPDNELGSMYLLKNGDQGIKALGIDPVKAAQQSKAAAAKDDIVKAAQATLSVLDSKKNYKTDKEYQDAKRYTASRLSSATGFGEGGKSLTGSELGILSGSLVNIKPQRQQNILEKITGEVPPATGEIVDDEETIRNKMNNAISYLKTGKVAPGASPEQTKKDAGVLNRLITGGAKNTADIVGGLGNLAVEGAKAGVNVAKDVQQTGGKNLQWGNIIPTFGEVGVGAINDLNETVGRPLEGGDVLGRATEHAIDNPVNTALYALPEIKGAKIAGAKIGAKLPPITVAKPNLGGVAKDIQGRAATNVGVADTSSIVKSEQLMKEALQSTNAITPRGMSKQLDAITPKAGAHIDKAVTTMDKIIGAQPLNEVLNQVMEKVKQSSSAAADPQLTEIVRKDLAQQLNTGVLDGGLARGQLDATTMGKINAVRKYLNSPLSSWFKNGQPVGTPANDLNAMKWEASNALKDILGEADSTGEVGKAIRLQHAAMSIGPVLAQKALNARDTNSIVGAVRKYVVNPVSEPLGIVISRALQGSPDNVVKEIRASQLPPIQTAAAPVAGASATPLPPIMSSAQNVPKEVLDTILQGKGEPQATHLLRDNRYSVGNWQARATTADRKATEKLVQRSSKKRYK